MCRTFAQCSVRRLRAEAGARSAVRLVYSPVSGCVYATRGAARSRAASGPAGHPRGVLCPSWKRPGLLRAVVKRSSLTQRYLERTVPLTSLVTLLCLAAPRAGQMMLCGSATRSLIHLPLRRYLSIDIFDRLSIAPDAPRAEVRRRYLEEALAIHPDHCSDEGAAARMAELQASWEAYRRSDARRRVRRAPRDGFAAFGVGCSFADSEAESAERAEIIAMAARGVMNPRPLEARDERLEDRSSTSER